MRISPFDHFHKGLRTTLKMAASFVLHSLRYTYGTRLGKGGADIFTIIRLTEHSSVTVSQRYVHPTPEALERVVERLETLKQKVIRSLSGRSVPSLVESTDAESIKNGTGIRTDTSKRCLP